MDQPQRRTSTTAIFSIIFGCLAWVAIPLVGAVVSIVTGHLAKKEIAASGGEMDGRSLATTGLVLGYLQVSFIVVAMLTIAALTIFGDGLRSSFASSAEPLAGGSEARIAVVQPVETTAPAPARSRKHQRRSRPPGDAEDGAATY